MLAYPKRRTPLFLPLTAFVALWPSVALADPQCKPFESAGCLFITAFLTSIFLGPMSLMGLGVILGVGLKRAPAKKNRVLAVALGAFPVAYFAGLLAIQISPEGILPFVGGTLLALALYAGISLRLLLAPGAPRA